MANVKDGSVTWSIESIYNAGQLNGLTAEQIKGQVNIPVKGVLIVKGTFTVGSTSSGGFYGGNIPVPSGYSRSQCTYWIENKTYEFSNNGGVTLNTEIANNKQGQWAADSSIRGSGVATVYYVLWAYK